MPGYPSASFPVATTSGTAGIAANGVYQPGTAPGAAGPSYAGFGPNSTSVAINGWLGAVDVGSSNIPASLNPTGIAPLTIVSLFPDADAGRRRPDAFQEIIPGTATVHIACPWAKMTGGGDIHFNPGPGPLELQFTTIPAADMATNGFAFNASGRPAGTWLLVSPMARMNTCTWTRTGVLARTSCNATGINIVGTTHA